LPLRIVLSAGQASDKTAVAALLAGLPPAKGLVADRGYDAKAIVEMVRQHGGQAYIPTQRDRKVQRSVDPEIYRQRNLIERFFCKLKHFRRGRNPLRQARQKFPRDRSHRIDQALAQNL
jgi:transposase